MKNLDAISRKLSELAVVQNDDDIANLTSRVATNLSELYQPFGPRSLQEVASLSLTSLEQVNLMINFAKDQMQE